MLLQQFTKDKGKADWLVVSGSGDLVGDFGIGVIVDSFQMSGILATRIKN